MLIKINEIELEAQLIMISTNDKQWLVEPFEYKGVSLPKLSIWQKELEFILKEIDNGNLIDAFHIRKYFFTIEKASPIYLSQYRKLFVCIHYKNRGEYYSREHVWDSNLYHAMKQELQTFDYDEDKNKQH